MSKPDFIKALETHARRSYGRRGERAVRLLLEFIEAEEAGIAVTEAAELLDLSKSTVSEGWLREGKGSFNKMIESFEDEFARQAGFRVQLSRQNPTASWVLTIEQTKEAGSDAGGSRGLHEHIVYLARAWDEDSGSYARVHALRSDDPVRDFLTAARPLGPPVPAALPAFCVVASLYLDEKWPTWVELYRDNRLAGVRAAALLDNPQEHLRPALRAMLALERFAPEVRQHIHDNAPLSHTGRRLLGIAEAGRAREHIERIAARPPPDGPKAAQVLRELERPTFAERLLLD